MPHPLGTPSSEMLRNRSQAGCLRGIDGSPLISFHSVLVETGSVSSRIL